MKILSDCSSICSQSNWSVSLVVSDMGRSGLSTLKLQEGKGVLTLFQFPPSRESSVHRPQLSLNKQQADDSGTSAGGLHQHQARLETGDPLFNVSGWTLDSSQPLWVKYTSSCCSTQAEILVWDTAGNMKRCHLTSAHQRQLSDMSTDSNRAEPNTQAFLLLPLLFLSWLWLMKL